MSTIDGTQRVVFSPGRLRLQREFGEAQIDVSAEMIDRWLPQAVNAVIAQGDEPSQQGLWKAYFVLVRTPMYMPGGQQAKVSFPLIWARSKPWDRVISAHTDQNHGVVWTLFAINPQCSSSPHYESNARFAMCIAPFLRWRYGDEVAEDLASFAAWQHFRAHGFKDIVTWQRSVCHIAVTGFESRTGEFELQDFIANVIVVA
ncbi:hypothetical protein [Microvirga aerophila]|uniref:hypothetical protein n=1 Tax=Microvirga aerophila TaxID=670291 RepID=UPI000DEF492F|nr:hypothetical protein [Microvirga aerophila]